MDADITYNSESQDSLDVFYKPPQSNLVKTYEYFLAEYEREMHDSYKLDVQIQDLKMQLEHKIQKLKRFKAEDLSHKYRKLEEEMYLNQRVLGETLDINKNSRDLINKLRLDKLATKLHVKKTETQLLRSNSAANLFTRRRQKYENNVEAHQSKIKQAAHTINGNFLENMISTGRLRSEIASASRFKRFQTPIIKSRVYQTSAPITRLLNKKWVNKAKIMNKRLDERQERTNQLLYAISEIMQKEKLKTYDQIVVAFTKLYEEETHLEKKLYIFTDKHCKLQEKTSYYKSSIQTQHHLKMEKQDTIDTYQKQLIFKESHLSSNISATLAKLNLLISTIETANNEVDILSSNLDLAVDKEDYIMSKLPQLEHRLNDISMIFKFTRNPKESIFGLFSLNILEPKKSFRYLIPNLDWEVSEAFEEKPLSLQEIHNKTRATLEYLRLTKTRMSLR